MKQFIAAYLPVLSAVVSAVIAAVLSGLITWFITRRTAKKSGAFRKADLRVQVFGKELLPNAEFQEIMFALGSSIANIRDRAFCIVRFQITNKGTLTAKDVKLRVAWPVALVEDVERLDIERLARGALTESYYVRKTFTDPPYIRTDYRLESLDPGSIAQIDEFVEVAHASGAPLEFSGETADGVPVRVKAEVRWQTLPVHATIQATDCEKGYGSFSVRSYPLQSIDEISDRLKADLPKAAGKTKQAHLRGDLVTAIVVKPNLLSVPKPEAMSEIEWSVYVQQEEGTEGWILVRWEPASKGGMARKQRIAFHDWLAMLVSKGRVHRLDPKAGRQTPNAHQR